MQQTQPRLLTEGEAARMLNVSVRHLQNLRRRGVIPYLRLGEAVRYHPQQLDQWARAEAEKEQKKASIDSAK